MSLGNIQLKILMEPAIEKLPDTRLRITRRWEVKSDNFADSDKLETRLFQPWGTLDGDYSGGLQEHTPLPDKIFEDAVLVQQEIIPASAKQPQHVLVKIYETIGNEPIPAGRSVVDYQLNGLRRTTEYLVAKSEYAGNLGTVGVTQNDEGDFLASLNQEKGHVIQNITRQYLEPGIVSEAVSSGPSGIPGSIRITRNVWGGDRDDVAGVVAAYTPPDTVPYSSSTENVEGYPVINLSFIKWGADSPLDTTIASYKQSLRVTRPGTIEIETQAVTGGHIPYLKVRPPSPNTVVADVTISITLTPPTDIPVAYNLDDVSVGATILNVSERFVGLDVATSGSTSTIVAVYSTTSNVQHQDFRAHYYVGDASVTESYVYVGGINRNDDPIAGETFDNTSQKTIVLDGADGPPALTGLFSIDVDPVFTAIDGTIYYRVTRIEIPA